MRDIVVTNIGLDTPHSRDLIYDRPKGIPEWLLMCFSTPFYATTNGGVAEGSPGDVMLMPPNVPQRHGTPLNAKGGFRNDWMHFTGDAAARLVSAYAVPVNTIISTGRTDFITGHLSVIQGEMHAKRPRWEDMIRLEVEHILLRLSRHAALPERYRTGKQKEQYARFIEIRAQLQKHAADEWSVSAMAEQAHMSANRFTSVYRAFFGTSPMDDLITMRLENAKAMLAHSDVPIGRVAELTGFQSPYYFSRIFKKRCGMSPEAYRSQ
ncbi:MAG: AraC family transcriptional regulator [Spirochaetota bacterium]